MSKTKCAACREFMNEVDDDGLCFRCELQILFSHPLDGDAGAQPGTNMGVAMSLVELVRMRVLQRLVFRQKPADEFIADVYAGLVWPEEVDRQGNVRCQSRN